MKRKKQPFSLPKEFDFTDSQVGELINVKLFESLQVIIDQPALPISLQVWDDTTSAPIEIKVLSNRENLNPPSSLPITGNCFIFYDDMPCFSSFSWIAGNSGQKARKR